MDTTNPRLNKAAVEMWEMLTKRAALGDMDAQAFMAAIAVAITTDNPTKHLTNFLQAYPKLLKEFGSDILAAVVSSKREKKDKPKITPANLFPAPKGLQ